MLINDDFVATETVGGFGHGSQKNTFEDIVTEAYENMLVANVDIMSDINSLLKNNAKIQAYKDLLLGELRTECAEMQNDPDRDYGTHASMYDQISKLFDNCIDDLKTESASVGQLLPIKTLDLPILIKQQLKLVTKDIMQSETTPSPVIKKHIEQTYVVDPKSKKRWKYPQCFFNDDFKEIYAAGKGLPIKPTKVTLPAYNFDVVDKCTDGVKDKDKFTIDLKIEKVYADIDGEEIPIVLHQPMRINLSDGMWLGGKINQTVTKSDGTTVEVQDIVSGLCDFVTQRNTLNSVAGVITAVEFSGFLSNERNERSVTFDYEREEIEWKIEDGMRVDAPFSLEKLRDTKALTNIDLYQKTYNNITELLTQMEDSNVLAWLDEEFEKYDGVELDPLGWNSFITKDNFDCDSTSITTALPNQYISEMLKFKIDRLLIDIADKAKLDDFTFVIYGNPRLISFLKPNVDWVQRPGSMSNGVKLDYGYGIMTSGDVKVQVVSTKKRNVKYDNDEKIFRGIRIIPFPLSKEQFTFKEFKYGTHILTEKNSAYRSSDLPGGSYTYIVGTSRYTVQSIQGIQAELSITNAEEYINIS